MPGQPRSGFLASLAQAMKANVGVGILSLPYALAQAGVVAGPVVFLLLVCVVYSCLRMLIAVKMLAEDLKAGSEDSAVQASIPRDHLQTLKVRVPSNFTYTSVAWFACGTFGKVFASVSMLAAMLGACTAYLIFIMESMAQYVALPGLPKQAWVALCVLVLVSLAHLRSLHFLYPLSIAGMVALLVAVASLFAYAGAHPDMFQENAPAVPLFAARTLPLFFGIAAFANEGVIGLIIPIHNAMEKPEQVHHVCVITLVVMTLLNLSFALVGVLLFGPDVDDSVIDALPHTTPTFLLLVSLCVQLVFTYPLVMYICYEMVEDALVGPLVSDASVVDDGYEQFDEERLASAEAAPTPRAGNVILAGLHKIFVFEWRRVCIRSGLVFLTAVVAIAVPKFGLFLALIGACANALVLFVIPPVLYVCTYRAALSISSLGACALIVAVGLLAVLVGTWVSAVDLVRSL